MVSSRRILLIATVSLAGSLTGARASSFEDNVSLAKTVVGVRIKSTICGFPIDPRAVKMEGNVMKLWPDAYQVGANQAKKDEDGDLSTRNKSAYCADAKLFYDQQKRNMDKYGW
jgi:hypothetical protein